MLRLMYLSSDLRCAYLPVKFVCTVPFSCAEASWLKPFCILTAELPGTRTHKQIAIWERALINVCEFWGQW